MDQNVNNSEHETQQSSKTLQSTDKENKDLVETNEEGNIVGPNDKDNLFNPQQKEITSSDDTNISSDEIILIQKTESLKPKADKA